MPTYAVVPTVDAMMEEEEGLGNPLLETSFDDSLSTDLSRPPVRHGMFGRFHAFLDGPRPRVQPKAPRTWPRLQTWLEQHAPFRSASQLPLLLLFYLIWALVSGGLIYRSSFSAVALDDASSPEFLSCSSTMWRLKNGCGLDGRNCEPNNGTSFEFRCPANCKAVIVLNDRPVGAQVVIHRPFVVGSGPYRADSMICASAIHAGIMRDATGGCGRLLVTGPEETFTSSLAHGIDSVSFDSPFPKSYTFVPGTRYGGCEDLRWPITGVNAAFSVVHALCQPSLSWYYWILFITTYFHIALVSDPPSTTGAELLSRAFEGFLPALFVGYAFWITAARWTLKQVSALDRTIFWLGGLWFGALLNYISDAIPISRLLLSDIVRDGGIYWFFGVLLLILAIIVGQMNLMRKAGDLVYYLKIYLTGLFTLIALGCIPGLTFRLHHYIFALLLVPGTAYPTRLSMVYQGILIGLFLDGVARWGFDSILETAAHLREDGALFSELPTLIIRDWAPSGVISWTGTLPLYHQYSVLINDVERYRGLATTFDPRTLSPALLEHVPYYIRIAFAFGDAALDYTDAATFYANGTMVYTDPVRLDKD